MRSKSGPSRLVLAGLAVGSSFGVELPPGAAQDSSGTADTCSLLTNADVERITGSRLYGDPEPTALGGGSACTYGGGAAQVILFSGEDSGQRFDAFVRAFGHGDEPRHLVPGAGDGAYVTYPEPRNKYQDTVGLLVVPLAGHTLGITLAAAEGQPAGSVQPGLIALANAVQAKLRRLASAAPGLSSTNPAGRLAAPTNAAIGEPPSSRPRVRPTISPRGRRSPPC